MFQEPKELLNPKRQIDRELGSFMDLIELEKTPSYTDQLSIVTAYVRNSEQSRAELLAMFSGYLATIIHPFRSNNEKHNAFLIETASQLLCNSALTYQPGDDSFILHAMKNIQADLLKRFPWLEGKTVLQDDQANISELYRYTARLQSPRSAKDFAMLQTQEDSLNETTKSYEILQQFPEAERGVLPYIHLPTPEIAAITGLPEVVVTEKLKQAAYRKGFSTRRELADWAYTNGLRIIPKVPKKPLHLMFTETQRQIGLHAHLSDQEMSDMFEVSDSYLRSTMYVMSQRAGARTRIELNLMFLAYDSSHAYKAEDRLSQILQKTGVSETQRAKLSEKVHLLSERARHIVQQYYLSGEDPSWGDVAADLNITPAVARATARQALMRVAKWIRNG